MLVKRLINSLRVSKCIYLILKPVSPIRSPDYFTSTTATSLKVIGDDPRSSASCLLALGMNQEKNLGFIGRWQKFTYQMNKWDEITEQGHA